MYFSFSPSPPSTSHSTLPMDIPSASSSRQSTPSCAYPSWPRRSSLDSNEDREAGHATSYISDDDLVDLYPSVFEEQDCTPIATPSRTPEFQEQVIVDTGAIMRELIAQEKAKKEKRRRRSSSKKSRSGSGTSSKHMSPIAEAGE